MQELGQRADRRRALAEHRDHGVIIGYGAMIDEAIGSAAGEWRHVGKEDHAVFTDSMEALKALDGAKPRLEMRRALPQVVGQRHSSRGTKPLACKRPHCLV